MIGRERQRLTSASALRNIPREQRALETKRLGSASQQLQTEQTSLTKTSTELQRLSRLPTREQAIAQLTKDFKDKFRVARKIGLSDAPLTGLSKDVRKFAVAVREGKQRKEILDKILAEQIKQKEIVAKDFVGAAGRGFDLPIERPKKFADIRAAPKIVKEKFQETEIGKAIKLRGDITQAKFEEKRAEIRGRDTGQAKAGALSGVALEKTFTGAAKTIQPFLKFGAKVTGLGKVVPPVARGFERVTGFRFPETVTEKEATEEISAFLKFVFFLPPGIIKGTVKKGAKTTSQKLTEAKASRDFSALADEAATNARNSFIRKGDSAVREDIRRILQTKDPKQINQFRKFLEDAIGKKDTSRIFKDVAQQETFILEGRISGIAKSKIDAAQRTLAKQIKSTSIKIEPSVFQARGTQFEFAPELTRGVLTQSGIVGAVASRLRNDQRVSSQIKKNIARVAFANLSLGDRVRAAELQQEKQRNLLKTGLTTSQLTKTQQVQREAVRQQERQRLRQRQRGLLRTAQQARQQARERLRLRAKAKPPKRVPKAFLFAGVKKKRPLVKPIKKIEQGYNAFVKSRGKRIKANINPLTKAKALDLSASIVDRTTSRTGIIKRANRPAKKPLVQIPRNYFRGNLKKWRGKIVKGKEQPIKKRFIERSRFAIDTLGEKKQLSAARAIAKLKQKARRRSKPPKFKRV